MEGELIFALDVVGKACKLTKAIQQGKVSRVFEKVDKSPVTMADYACQLLVTYFLQESFPGERLVGEEDLTAITKDDELLKQVSSFLSPYIPDFSLERIVDGKNMQADEAGSRRFWVLDPIDGTKGFLRGEQYAIALALLVDNLPVLGVLGCPNLDLKAAPDGAGSGILAYAVRGQGAWTRQIDAPETTVPLSVSNCSEPSLAQFVSSLDSTGHSNNDAIAVLKTQLGNQVPIQQFDSQAKYVMVAAGRYDLFLRQPPADNPGYHEKVWDHAAGSIIVQEAGGKVTDLYGKAFDFSHGRALETNSGVVVSNGLIHQAVVDFFRA